MLRTTPLALALWFALAAPARAEDGSWLQSVVVVERDPAQCLDAETLRTQASAWVRRQSAPEGVRVTVTPGPSPQSASFEVRRGEQLHGVRSFDTLPGDCAARRAALGLAIAVALDQGVLDELLPPRPEDEPTPVAQDEVEGGEGEPEERAVRVSLAGGAQYGMLPRVGLLGAVGVDFEPLPGWIVRGGLLGTPRERVRVGDGTAEVSAAGAQLEGCAAWALGKQSLSSCLGTVVGLQFAEGLDFSEVRKQTLPWLIATASVTLRFLADGPSGIWVRGLGHARILAPALQTVDRQNEPVDRVSPPAVGFSGLFGLWVRLR